MIRLVLPILTALIFLFGTVSCTRRIPAAFDPKPEDMLTKEERKALLDYACRFIHSAKGLHVTAYERRRIMTEPPVSYKIHYRDSKYGRVVIIWSFPGERQIVARYEGELLLRKQRNPSWGVSVVSGSFSGDAVQSASEYGL